MAASQALRLAPTLLSLSASSSIFLAHRDGGGIWEGGEGGSSPETAFRTETKKMLKYTPKKKNEYPKSEI